ncbi:anion permease [Bacillus altitudinis]|uniref:anion permease n=2 Tax=Bacillaceae TaxID=186817 RepID=UPI00064FEAF8|nr:anion permease [Bacillus sp. LK10]KML15060.1 hypothetical protein VL09_14535 [Bacillus stratosphericus]KML63575.1 hypothetical protein VL19_03330 [Bacillus stratosphericus]KMN34407.1 hypothetical protein ABW26_03485 [Bacillus stratosphericus]KMN74050.1 hypothetical protein VK97_07005 [Bacillus sp. LK10]
MGKYKSDKTYYSIQLSKEDFLELEKILTDKFPPGNSRKSFTVRTPNRDFSPMSMYGFLNEQVPQKIDSVSLDFSESTRDYPLVKYLRIYVSKVHINVSIEGTDEVWVQGMGQLLNTFFSERKSIVLQLANFIPYVAGGLIGINIGAVSVAIAREQILSAVLTGFLLLIGFNLANPFLMRKVFPLVKFSLFPKTRRDWLFFWTVTGSVGTISSLIIAVVALWK